MEAIQFINRIINSEASNLLTESGLEPKHFLHLQPIYDFILDYNEKYNQVPNHIVIQTQFPDFPNQFDDNTSIEYLVERIYDQYLYEKVARPMAEKASDLFDVNVTEAIEYMQGEISSIDLTLSAKGINIGNAQQRIDFGESKKDKKWFISTGFQELDDIITGWQQVEEFVILLARSGIGKSWMLTKVLSHAWQTGYKVGLISPEMSADKIGYRVDTLLGGFSNTALNRWDTNRFNINEYNKHSNKIKEWKEFVIADPEMIGKRLTVSKIKQFIQKYKIDILGIDGLSYIIDERANKGDNKTTSLTNISEDLFRLSKKMGLPIIAAVQSNRGGVKDGESPGLDNIRDSDGIAFNATKVISLRQPEMNQLEMTIVKNRDGIMGKKLLYFWDFDSGNISYNGEEQEKPRTIKASKNDDIDITPKNDKRRF